MMTTEHFTLTNGREALIEYDGWDTGAAEKMAAALRDFIAYVESLTAPPTEQEREALANLIPLGFRARDGVRNVFDAADRILASDVWRNRHREPITDEMVEAALNAWLGLESPYADSSLCVDWRRRNAPYMRAALEATEAHRG